MPHNRFVNLLHFHSTQIIMFSVHHAGDKHVQLGQRHYGTQNKFSKPMTFAHCNISRVILSILSYI